MQNDEKAAIAEADTGGRGSVVQLLDVSPQLEPYVEAALLRLNYIYAHVHFLFERGSICVDNVGEFEIGFLKTEVAHALYREKIFAETLPMRKAMYARIFG